MRSLPVLEAPPTWARDLERLKVGAVRWSAADRLLYATDASIYQVEPLGVVIPDSAESLRRAVEYCGRRGIPMLPRGGGTSLAGQCVNRAVVIDHSAGCKCLIDVDVEGCRATVEPGMTVDEVNRELERRGEGLFFAPDPATAAQATIGGCIGNNAAGARSIRYGRTSENVAALDVCLPRGQRVRLGPGAGRHDSAALDLATRVAAVVRSNGEEIRRRFPKTVRRNAGYALDLILDQTERGVSDADLDLTGLLCGSEGTLAVVLSAQLKLHPIPTARGLAIVSFATLEDAINTVSICLTTRPSAIELIDDVVLETARGNSVCRQYLDLCSPVNGREPASVLYVEYLENSAEEASAGLDRLRAALGDSACLRWIVDAADLTRAWALRKAGEPLLHGLAGQRKPVTCVEDNAVPPENLARFVCEFKKIVERHGTKAAYYAHASVGVLHVRPLLDLHDPSDRDRLRAIAVEAADLARDCGGVMSGEHGDGRIRGPLLERFYGPQIMAAFRQVKAIFDPENLLNPGMIVQPGPVESITADLRVVPAGRTPAWPNVETYFDYGDQDGFASAVEMCNGAGVCRKTAGGTMCPSYRATLDEKHATRGRGNALRLAITGQTGGLGIDDPRRWDDPGAMESLALCLSCKACKSECPSNVDIARLKAEYTAQRYRHTGKVPLSAKVFGHVRRLNRLGAAVPGPANFVNRLRPVRGMLNKLLDLAPQRSLPAFAPSLYRWFKKRNTTTTTAVPAKVVLFPDCFVTYNEPGVGQAATRVLEAFGYQVEFPKVGCCGRALISTGLLEDAIRSADRVLESLRPYVEDDNVKAIVVCEPSCLSAFKDDYLSLRLQTPMELRRKLAAKAFLVEDFLDRAWDAHPARPAFNTADAPVLLHGHCHQKSLWGDATSSRLLRRLVGDHLTVLASGCCGMAGAFGYTAERYELSMKIGEQTLFGPVRQSPAEALVLAPGTSCRHQIRDGTGRTALHPVELVDRLLQKL